MNLRRVVCRVRGHDPQQTVKFMPGEGVKVTVTSEKARCRRCGDLVEVVRPARVTMAGPL